MSTYSELRVRVAQDEARCEQNRLIFRCAAKDAKQVTLDRISRPSSLGVAFTSGFLMERIQYRPDDRNRHSDRKKHRVKKVVKTLSSLVAQRMLLKLVRLI